MRSVGRGEISTFFIACVVLVMLLLWSGRREGLVGQNGGFKQLNNGDIFTPAYSRMHDTLFRDESKEAYEADLLTEVAGIKRDSTVVEVGSGTGHRLACLAASSGCRPTGLEDNRGLVSLAQNTYPKGDFAHGSIYTSSGLADRGRYSHVLVLNFEVYKHADKARFMRSLYGVLAPGGRLALHLVNRDKFDPAVPASAAFVGVSPQNYTDTRIVRSRVVFDTHDYVSDLKVPSKGDEYVFVETLTPKDGGQTVQNRTNLYMPQQKAVLAQARDAGFSLLERYELDAVGYNHHHIYILQKDE
jgi:SAM-dependent methyltransferase